MDHLTAIQKAGAKRERLPSRDVVLLGSWDTKLLQTYLQAHAFDLGIDLRLHANSYGSLAIALRGLGRDDPFPPGAPVVVLLDEELVLPGFGLRSDALPDRPQLELTLSDSLGRVQEFIGLLSEIASQRKLVLVPSPIPPVPLLPSWMGAESRMLQVRHQLRQALAEFQAAHPLKVRVLPPESIWDRLPLAEIADDRLFFGCGWPLSLAATDLLARALAVAFQADAPSRKLLITDADNTLWRGIAGDDGAEAVSWTQEADTYRFFLYQKFLNFLMSEGVLVAIASKNTPEVLEAVLSRRDLLLHRDKLAACKASWAQKSEVVAEILAETNLLPSSLVVVDDSLFELGELGSVHSEVRCIRFPSDNRQLRGFLEELRGAFDTRVVTEEDRQRSRTLRHAGEFQRRVGSAVSLDAYLAGLGMKARIEPLLPGRSERAFQLINKTNQFNLNGRRFDAQEWDALLRQPHTRAWQLAYLDSQADYGVVSVMLADARGDILAWVLSCRVFSRTIEHFFLNFALRQLAPDGKCPVRLHLAPTGRNQVAIDFIERVATSPRGSPSEAWTLDHVLPTHVALLEG